MCQVNNERERNILGEEKEPTGREPIWWRMRRRRKEKEKKKVGSWETERKKKCVGEKKVKGERKIEDFPGVLTVGA